MRLTVKFKGSKKIYTYNFDGPGTADYGDHFRKIWTAAGHKVEVKKDKN